MKLDNYSFEQTLTEISVGGALLYIKRRLFWHPRNPLNVFMAIISEFVLTEVTCFMCFTVPKYK